MLTHTKGFLWTFELIDTVRVRQIRWYETHWNASTNQLLSHLVSGVRLSSFCQFRCGASIGCESGCTASQVHTQPQYPGVCVQRRVLWGTWSRDLLHECEATKAARLVMSYHWLLVLVLKASSAKGWIPGRDTKRYLVTTWSWDIVTFIQPRGLMIDLLLHEWGCVGYFDDAHSKNAVLSQSMWIPKPDKWCGQPIEDQRPFLDSSRAHVHSSILQMFFEFTAFPILAIAWYLHPFSPTHHGSLVFLVVYVVHLQESWSQIYVRSLWSCVPCGQNLLRRVGELLR